MRHLGHVCRDKSPITSHRADIPALRVKLDCAVCNTKRQKNCYCKGSNYGNLQLTQFLAARQRLPPFYLLSQVTMQVPNRQELSAKGAKKGTGLRHVRVSQRGANQTPTPVTFLFPVSTPDSLTHGPSSCRTKNERLPGTRGCVRVCVCACVCVRVCVATCKEQQTMSRCGG